MFVKLGQRKGLTLVEMVVSVLILGMALGVMLSCFVIGRVSATKAKHRMKAMNLLRAKMEWVKGQSYSTIEGWIGNPIIENDVDDAIGADELIDDTRTTTVAYDADNNLIVTITLNWRKRRWGGLSEKGGGGNPPDEELVTLIGGP